VGLLVLNFVGYKQDGRAGGRRAASTASEGWQTIALFQAVIAQSLKKKRCGVMVFCEETGIEQK
jgi:hypothetical protein